MSWSIAVVCFLTLTFFLFSYWSLNRRKVVIRKGGHSPFFEFALHLGKRKIEKRVMFTDSCLYEADREHDWNKLMGLSYGYHHHNSIRVGWRRNSLGDNSVDLGIYVYHKGERHHKRVKSLSLNQWYKLSLSVEGDEVTLVSKNKYNSVTVHYLNLKSDMPVMPGYFLWSYFGGQAKAPHDVEIKFKNVK